MVQYQEIIVQESKVLTQELNEVKQDKDGLHEETSQYKVKS